MNISTFFILFTVSILQIGSVAAQGPRVPVASPVGPGKPDHGASDRDLGWWSTSKSSKWSKSIDHPTLFPTMFPTMSPTYCGKSSKSSWSSWHSGRRLGDWSWTTKSSKTTCWSGSRRSKSWWNGWDSRKSRDHNNLREGHHNYRKKRNGRGNKRDLGEDEVEDEAQLKSDEIKTRRRISGGKHAHLIEQEP